MEPGKLQQPAHWRPPGLGRAYLPGQRPYGRLVEFVQIL